MCDPNTTCVCGANDTAMPFWDEEPVSCVDPSLTTPSLDGPFTPLEEPPGFSMGEVHTELQWEAAVMSCGQSSFYGEPVCRDEEPPPILPPSLLERLLTRPPETGLRRDQSLPPPPQSVISIVEGSDGSIEVSSQYGETVFRGHQALIEFGQTLEKARNEVDPVERMRLLEHAGKLLETFRRAGQSVHDTHTRNGRTEYQTIKNWTDELYDLRRSKMQGPISSSEFIPVEGVMLGFNLAAINRHDHNYKSGTGTAVKFLLEYVAQKVAPEYGGRTMGMWGTNVAVAGIPADQVEAFHKRVQNDVIKHLKSDTLPEEVVRRVYGIGKEGAVPRMRTADLEAGKWLVRNPNNLGLTAGHYSTIVDIQEIRQGETELHIIAALEGMGEAEAEARRTNQKIFTGPVPQDSPVRGRAGRPLLRTEAILTEVPHGVDPIKPGQFNETLTAEQIREGRLPNPAREASASQFHYEQMHLMLESVRSFDSMGDVYSVETGLDDILRFLEAPGNNRGDGTPRSVSETLQVNYEASLQQHRFPGVFRLDFFPELARRTFEGERFFIQMAEYRDYWGHNRTHSADAADSLHRLSIDILAEGYRYKGVDVLVGTNGGDEIFFALRGRTADGKDLSETDVQRISEYLNNQFNRIFQSLDHHQVVKAPRAPGGLFEGRPYIVHEGRIYVEERPKTQEARERLLSTVELAHGEARKAGDIVEVKSLSEISQVERLRLWRRVTDSGRAVEILVPEGVKPAGFFPVIIPLSTTITPAVEIPAGSSSDLVERALTRVGDMAEEMKKAGIDRPYPAEVAEQLRSKGIEVFSPIVKMSFLDRFMTSKSGRMTMDLATNGGMFVFADVGSDLILAPFGYGNLDRLGTAEGWGEVTLTGGAILGGAHLGDVGMRRLVGMSASAQLAGAGWRGWAVRGGGFLGPLIMLDALHHGGDVDVGRISDMALSMGEAMLVVRGGSWAVGRILGAVGEARGISWLAGVRGATSKGGVWGLLATLVLIIGEFGYMKIRGDQKLEEVLSQNEGVARGEAAVAMHKLDRIIDEGRLFNEDGSMNETEYGRFQAALEKVTEANANYLSILRLNRTEEGRDFAEEAQELEEVRLEAAEWEKKWPEYKVDPDTGERYRTRDHCTNGYISTICGSTHKLREAKATRVRWEQEDYDEEMLEYQEAFKGRIQTKPSEIPGVPVYVRTNPSANADQYSTALSDDPVAFYWQSLAYLESRAMLIDQTLARETDPQLYPDAPQGPLVANGAGY